MQRIPTPMFTANIANISKLMFISEECCEYQHPCLQWAVQGVVHQHLDLFFTAVNRLGYRRISDERPRFFFVTVKCWDADFFLATGKWTPNQYVSCFLWPSAFIPLPMTEDCADGMGGLRGQRGEQGGGEQGGGEQCGWELSSEILLYQLSKQCEKSHEQRWECQRSQKGIILTKEPPPPLPIRQASREG